MFHVERIGVRRLSRFQVSRPGSWLTFHVERACDGSGSRLKTSGLWLLCMFHVELRGQHGDRKSLEPRGRTGWLAASLDPASS